MIVVPITELNDKWWIVYNNDKTIVNYGKTEAPQQTETGLPLNEVFSDEQTWLNRLSSEFSIVPE